MMLLTTASFIPKLPNITCLTAFDSDSSHSNCKMSLIFEISHNSYKGHLHYMAFSKWFIRKSFYWKQNSKSQTCAAATNVYASSITSSIIIAILPPTSPTTVNGGFSLDTCFGNNSYVKTLPLFRASETKFYLMTSPTGKSCFTFNLKDVLLSHMASTQDKALKQHQVLGYTELHKYTNNLQQFVNFNELH